MPVDLHASDPAFDEPGKRPAEHLNELIASARAELGLGDDRPWVVISSRMKLRKSFFEVEENGRRLIGKVSSSDRSKGAFELIKALWNAGMRPPNPHTVVEPIAFLPKQQLLLQEKAPGVQVVELIRARSSEALQGVERAAMWLHSLQALPLRPPPESDYTSVVERCRAELAEVAPEHDRGIQELADECARGLGKPQRLVPSHGDYHPMNVYVEPGGRVTAIDLDTFASREPAADVAYFIAQTAIMGFHLSDSFAATREVREHFIECAPEVPAERVQLHLRLALLRSLHYDLCILRLGNTAQVEPFLRAARDGFDV
jgi:aminoglycoside phosphotransferase